MASNDKTYFTARATEERAMANGARDHRASVIHRKLAEGYQVLARNAAEFSAMNGVTNREGSRARR